MYKSIKYFGGLNALRFIAAYFVVFHHAEQIKKDYGVFHLKDYSFANNGGLAVIFFFVLSGFLITYLLIRERNDTGNISVKNFYVRRILRIWPLYFLLVIIGTLIVPIALDLIKHPYVMDYKFSDVILYYLFFAPFMVNIIYGSHLLEPLWSIGVEELFYIIWAPLFKYLRKYILQVILITLFLKILALLLANYLNVSHDVVRVLNMLKFEAMAIGGLGAYLVYNSQKSLESYRIFSVPVQIILFVFIFLKFFAFRYLSENYIVFDYLFETYIASELLIICVFAWLIISISLNKKSIIKLDHQVLNFLGDISYGIYMYHLIIIFGMVLILKNVLNKFDNILSLFIFYIAISTVIILVSYLSKVLFENRFLKLKSKFLSPIKK